MKIQSLILAGGVAVSAILASCGGNAKKDDKPKTDTIVKTDTVKVEPEKLKSIVEIASADPSFSTLVSLLQEAGWVDSLNQEGKTFTVFAPNNDAFNKIDAKKLEALKKDPKKLAEVLKYHVVAGSLKSGDVTGREELDALSGHVIKIFNKDGKITIGSDSKSAAGLVSTDIIASNGIIHVIDAVIMPPAKKAKAKPAPTPGGNNSTTEPDKGGDDKKGDKFGGKGAEDKTKSDKFGGDGSKENTGGDKKDKFGSGK